MATCMPNEPFGDSLLVCAICYDHYKNPKVLPCLHTFCQGCLERHYGMYKLRDSGKLLCPTCREVIPIPMTGVGGFKSDVVVGRVKEILRQLPGDSSSSSWDESFTSSSCTSDGQNEEMEEEDDRSDDETPSRRRNFHAELERARDPAIDVHQVTRGYTSSHNSSISDDSADADEKRGILRCHMDRLQKALAQIRYKMLHLYHIEVYLNSRKVAEIDDRIEQQPETHMTSTVKAGIKSEIEERHAPTIAQLVCEQDRLYREIIELKSVHDVLEEAVEKGLSPQIESMFNSLLVLVAPLQSIVKREANIDQDPFLKGLNLPEDLVNMVKLEMSTNNKTAIIPIPKMQHAKKAGVKFLFKISGRGSGPGKFDFPTHATFMPNGNILVADKNNLRLQIFDSKGNFIREMLTGHVKPRRARVNPISGLIYVSDELTECVRAYTPGGEHVHRIGEKNTRCVLGLDFDTKGNVVISDPEKGYISIFTPEGKVVKSFYYRQIGDKKWPNPYYVAVNEDDQILISDNRNHRMKVFTNTGQVLFMINKIDCPRGVCFDPYGNIVVTEGDNHRVTMFSPYGKYIQDVITTADFGLRYPLSVDMDRRGRMVVTMCGWCTPHEVMVFQVY